MLEQKTSETEDLARSLSGEKKRQLLSEGERRRLDTLEHDFSRMKNKADIAVKEAE